MTKQLEHSSLLIHRSIANERALLGSSGIDAILDAGRDVCLSSVLERGGALVFPHTYLQRCGHQVASCVHALLDSGADSALILGVLHCVDSALSEARERYFQGADPTLDSTHGVQGPGLPFRGEWRDEFSLVNFCFLLEWEAKRRNVKVPKLWIRYPYLVGSQPSQLQGIEELVELAKDSVLLATGDLYHHGAGYGMGLFEVGKASVGRMDEARSTIDEMLSLLAAGDYESFLALSYRARSDWWNVGPVLRHLIGPFTAKIHDITWATTDEYYTVPSPNWVVASLISFDRASAD